MPIESPKITRIISDYLLPPLDTELKFGYRVMLADVSGRPGVYQLSIDPNSCFLDEFGRALGCTLMAPFTYEVRLELISRDDELLLYDVITNDDQELPARFQLVLIDNLDRAECPARLLTLDEDDYITQIVHLHMVD